MSVASDLKAKLRLPVMAGPMFIASTADLVIAQCKAGIIGSMPALNPRSTAALDDDVARIAANVGECPMHQSRRAANATRGWRLIWTWCSNTKCPSSCWRSLPIPIW